MEPLRKLKFGMQAKGGLTHVEVEPILWLRTKQLMAGIQLFGKSLNARVSSALPNTGLVLTEFKIMLGQYDDPL